MSGVVGMDNALVDILIRVSDDTLAELGLQKGVINFPNEDVLSQLKAMPADKISPGGCAANTLSLLAKLGAKTTLLGKVGKDFHGETFETELQKDGVESKLVRAEGISGTAITLVTPDAQRTFALHLGVANTLTLDELPRFDGTILYLSNFYLTDPQCRETAHKAIERMRRHGGTVALDLSDPTVVAAHLEELKQFVPEHVDILFANEEEAEAFTGNPPEEAGKLLAELCDIAVVKIGEKGSLVFQGETCTRVAAHAVTAIDTTGAGDAYAAGFLYGWLNNWELQKAGDLGALLASHVIQQLGARLGELPPDVKHF